MLRLRPGLRLIFFWLRIFICDFIFDNWSCNMASLCLANRIISVYCSSVFDVLISSCRSDKNCLVPLLLALRTVCGTPATEKKIIKYAKKEMKGESLNIKLKQLTS